MKFTKTILGFAVLLLLGCDTATQSSQSTNQDDEFWQQMEEINQSIKLGEEMMGIPESIQNLRYRCTELQDVDACIALENWFAQNERYLREAAEKSKRDAEMYRRMYGN